MNTTVAVTFLLIVLARITDVTLDTIRTAAIVQGRRAFAAVLGFFEAEKLNKECSAIGELARSSDLKFKRDAGSFNHDFRTLIIDRAGHLQMVFPTGGKLSDAIVDEILRAAVVTNGSVVPATPAHAGTQNPER